ncbi:hypothetical protein [Pseudomonas aeruginosa]|uniref:hypothetical protein n=1 Tax=Pseudomonas aeruginosa TaxID=287 RepID=UPI000CFC92DC|nr:hypothetical protein [Pseudomonas aeruginosa]AVK18758.1 hypothetical protein CSB90_3488 [Pseudomonas aeruginosa]
MAKDTRDTHTLDAFPAKPSRGRPRKATRSPMLSGSVSTVSGGGQGTQVDADALVRLQNEFDGTLMMRGALVAHLRKDHCADGA